MGEKAKREKLQVVCGSCLRHVTEERRESLYGGALEGEDKSVADLIIVPAMTRDLGSFAETAAGVCQTQGSHCNGS